MEVEHAFKVVASNLGYNLLSDEDEQLNAVRSFFAGNDVAILININQLSVKTHLNNGVICREVSVCDFHLHSGVGNTPSRRQPC